MLNNKKILAVVPARSGSKGMPNKNMRTLMGVSLVGWAGRCLSELPWIDAKIISTDSSDYAEEGKKYGLNVPFLRPPELSTDTAGAVEIITHALEKSEKYYGKTFDIILIVEPTSPLRQPEDIEAATKLLIDSNADSVVTVNSLSTKFHPARSLTVEGGKLNFYDKRGPTIISRHSLDTLYCRNGICYALTRDCLLEKRRIITDNTLPFIVEREVVNIDEPIELERAEYLIAQERR